jgi:hypothetical protein
LVKAEKERAAVTKAPLVAADVEERPVSPYPDRSGGNALLHSVRKNRICQALDVNQNIN